MVVVTRHEGAHLGDQPMPTRYDQNEMEAFGGPSADRLRDWRRRALLEGMGEQRGGRWNYSLGEVLKMLCAGQFIDHPTKPMDIADALEVWARAFGEVFAWLVEGTAVDDDSWARRRKAGIVVIVVDYAKPDKSIVRVKVGPWTYLEPGRNLNDEASATVIYPHVVVRRLDPRFKRAFFKEYEEGSAALRLMVEAERKQS
jgi:hypothetical protein